MRLRHGSRIEERDEGGSDQQAAKRVLGPDGKMRRLKYGGSVLLARRRSENWRPRAFADSQSAFIYAWHRRGAAAYLGQRLVRYAVAIRTAPARPAFTAAAFAEAVRGGICGRHYKEENNQL